MDITLLQFGFVVFFLTCAMIGVLFIIHGDHTVNGFTIRNALLMSQIFIFTGIMGLVVTTAIINMGRS